MTQAEYMKLLKALDAKLTAGEIDGYAYREKKLKLKAMLIGNATMQTAQQVLGMDPGQKAADNAVMQTEKQLTKIYRDAVNEMQAEFASLQKELGPKFLEKMQERDDGKITQSEFEAWARMQTLQKDALLQKIDACSGVLLNANEKAAAIVNGKTVNVFAENANWQSYELTQDAKMNLMFSVYDERTVERLIRENPELIPRKVVNGKKDKAWNKKLLSNAVTQAIIQGDSIPKLARRVAMQTGESNMKAMMRYARTAMTGAQNGGRMDSLHRAHGMGIKVKKVWLATLDSRTRDSHQHLDGKSAEVDEKFPNGLLYPGDLGGPPGEIWNCRCTLTYDYEGFPGRGDRRDNETGQTVEDMTYDEWKTKKNQKKPGKKPREQKQNVPEEQKNDNRPADPMQAIRDLISGHVGEWSSDDLREVGKKAADVIDGRMAGGEYEKLISIQNDAEKEANRLYSELELARTEYRAGLAYHTKDVDERREKYNKLVQEYSEARQKYLDAEAKATEHIGKIVRGVISEVRPVGGVSNANMKEFMDVSKRSKTSDGVVDAMNYYPSEWLRKSKEALISLKPKWTTGRAYYSPSDGEIRVSERRATNVHELGHRFESTISAILEAERKYYAERTAGESAEWLGSGYGYSERARKDKFINAYMGKDYGGDGFELVSMGFQYAYTDYKKLSTDEDMRDWILGILLSL